MSIEILQQISFQQSSMWEFYILEGPPQLKLYITETSLPFKQLETETRSTGSKHYISVIPEGDFSITFRETTSWEVYNFLHTWFESVYDTRNKVFKTGSDKFKTGIVAFEKTTSPFTTSYNQSFQFNKLQIKGIEPISLNYSSSEPLEITASFVADEIVPASVSGVNVQLNLLNKISSATSTATALGFNLFK